MFFCSNKVFSNIWHRWVQNVKPEQSLNFKFELNQRQSSRPNWSALIRLHHNPSHSLPSSHWSVVLHPSILQNKSINDFLHGQVWDELILGQWSARHWVKMADTLWEKNKHKFYLLPSLIIICSFSALLFFYPLMCISQLQWNTWFLYEIGGINKVLTCRCSSMSFLSYVTPLGVMHGSLISSKLIFPHRKSGISRFCQTHHEHNLTDFNKDTRHCYH